jgi:phosphomannomutase/phosphoglucomutase
LEIFKAYDVRGIYPTMLDEQTALRIGKAFSTYNPGKIVVGNDTRLSGPSLKKKLIEGLTSTGAHIVDVGTTTSPALMFSTRFLDCDGGVMVTASHNPKEYNGFKFYRKNGIPISYEMGLNKVQELFEREKFSQGKGKTETTSIHDDYISFLLQEIRFRKKPAFKVVVDAGNGAGGVVNPSALKKAGLEVVELFCNPDGNYPNHQPDPSKPENVVALKSKVRETGADLGFGYDGDGDRLAVVDAEGNTVPTGVVFSILIQNALAQNPGGKVVYTALDSRAVDDVIRQHGGVPIVCRVGHTYITMKLLEEDAVVAGEISGHYYFRGTHGADDALFASLKIIESLVNSGKTLADYARDYPKYYSQVSEKCRFPVKESEKFPFIEQLKTRFKREGYKIDTLDGVKVLFEDGWAMFRPSNTEPVISVSYEAKTKQNFDRIEKLVQETVATIPK